MHLQTEPPLEREGCDQRGTVAVAASGSGFGFIEPDHLGGQLPMRAESILGGVELAAGDAVEYAVVPGPLGLEAVRVRPVGVVALEGAV